MGALNEPETLALAGSFTNALVVFAALLAALAVLAAVAVGARKRTASRRPLAEMADPTFHPDLDRHENNLRVALGMEAGRYDLYDVFPEEDR
ncbi:hypothetical protein [Nonomuraea bangladeshensis]|uniref:hypothetical protein n=1 Tax=Nonomuraea bangladeshensis TaxID=404385 RepID=UPI003C2E206E